MRVLLQPAYVLHHRLYRETSLLVDLFTEDYGRIDVVARGVRTKRSPLRSLLQPFTPLLVSFQGKSDLMMLQSAESHSTPLNLSGECLLSGFYLNELLVKVLQKSGPQPLLFSMYKDTLQQLQGRHLEQKILRLFEKRLLSEMGYGLQWQTDCITGELLQQEPLYRYCHEQGFTRCTDDHAADSFYVFSGKSLLALGQETLDDEIVLRDAKRLMRLLLTSILGIRELQSRKLFI